MRGPIDSAIRWWRSTEAAKNGGNGNGNGKPNPANPKTFKAASEPEAAAMLPVRVEAPWLDRLDEADIPRTLVYPSTTLGRMLGPISRAASPTPPRWSTPTKPGPIVNSVPRLIVWLKRAAAAGGAAE